jgi:AcrR family transcriptional regulator
MVRPMSKPPRQGNFRSADWVELAAKVLRLEGPPGLTIDNLCARAGRTKGSFYHHFKGVGELGQALALHWAESGREAAAQTALAGSTAGDRLRALLRLGAESDHRLEHGIRVLALADPALGGLVRNADDRRELILTSLLAAAYSLSGSEAHDYARLFHALHLAAIMRGPEEARTYGEGPAKALTLLLESNFPTS